MDLSRIRGVIDTTKTQAATATIVGAGGSAGLVANLARCGVGKFLLIDFDAVTEAHIARQAHDVEDIGRRKVQAVSDVVRRINPNAHTTCFPMNFLEMTDDRIDAYLGQTNLFIFATDHFAAQARAAERGESLDPPSDGCTIFDVSLLDAIAGMLAIGLITRGSDDRFGRLIDELGDRNFLQVQLDPAWTFKGRNVIREQLGVAADCAAFFAWNTITRSDPDRGQLPCPDCEKHRRRQFQVVPDGFARVKPG